MDRRHNRPHGKERLTLGQFESEDLLTVEEAAEVLGVSTRTLSDWRWRRRGPKVTKCGRLVRYFVRDLRAYLNGSEVAA